MGRRNKKGRNITGIIVIDKPNGRSSNNVLQQVKRLGRTRPETLGYAAADRVAVRKQVVEVVGDLLALDRQVLQIERQRQGQRSAHVGSKPIRVVLQFHLSASRNRPSANMNPVGPDGQASAV